MKPIVVTPTMVRAWDLVAAFDRWVDAQAHTSARWTQIEVLDEGEVEIRFAGGSCCRGPKPKRFYASAPPPIPPSYFAEQAEPPPDPPSVGELNPTYE